MEEEFCLLSEGINWSQVKTWASQRGTLPAGKRTLTNLNTCPLCSQWRGPPPRTCLTMNQCLPRTQAEQGLTTVLLPTCPHVDWHVCIQSCNSPVRLCVFTCLKGSELLEDSSRRAGKRSTFILCDPTPKPNSFSTGWFYKVQIWSHSPAICQFSKQKIF